MPELHSISSAFLPETSRRADITAYLVHAILNGDLKERDKLVIRTLARKFGIDPTAVRDAIVDLEAIGILKAPANESAIVRKLGPDELFEIYQLRRLLEGEAARLACGRIPRATLLKSREEVVELRRIVPSEMTTSWKAKVLRHDEWIHHIIAQFCGSSRLFHSIGRYAILMQVIREMVGMKRDGLLQMLGEHDSTLEALLILDPETAGRRMNQHIHISAFADIRVLFGPTAVEQMKNWAK